MAGQKKKLRYSEETPWFPEYYIGWIGIGNCDQKTSSIQVVKLLLINFVAKSDSLNFEVWVLLLFSIMKIKIYTYPALPKLTS